EVLPVRVGILFIGFAAVAALCGCGGQRAEFTDREEVAELIPEAQEHVHKVLVGDDEQVGHFGTPTNSVAWERLPVRFHGATGVFVENPSDGQEPLTALKVNLIEQNRPIES